MKAIQLETKKTIENFEMPYMEKMRSLLGPEYASIDIDVLRKAATNYRKRGRLGSVKGHGPRKGSGGGHTGKNKGATCSPKQ